MRSSDDRTTVARIRDAAVTEFAANGIAGTSIRTIAATAGVSPGLVIHHFGSKDELRAACDEFVAASVRHTKRKAMAEGAAFDPLAAMRAQGDGPPISKYIAKTLVDGSPHVADLVDEIVDDAVAYMEVGVATGMMKPSRYPKERAAILTMWTLGGLVLHEHLERLIGIDITDDFSKDPKAAAAYIGPAMEIASGFITEATVEMMSKAFVDAEPQEKTP